VGGGRGKRKQVFLDGPPCRTRPFRIQTSERRRPSDRLRFSSRRLRRTMLMLRSSGLQGLVAPGGRRNVVDAAGRTRAGSRRRGGFGVMKETRGLSRADSVEPLWHAAHRQAPLSSVGGRASRLRRRSMSSRAGDGLRRQIVDEGAGPCRQDLVAQLGTATESPTSAREKPAANTTFFLPFPPVARCSSYRDGWATPRVCTIASAAPGTHARSSITPASKCRPHEIDTAQGLRGRQRREFTSHGSPLDVTSGDHSQGPSGSPP